MRTNLEKIRKRNLWMILIGAYFFASLSTVFFSFFLPYYLKGQGLKVLEIGALFTLSIAIGHLFFGKVFANIQKKISLRSGLSLASVFIFLMSFLFYIIPNYLGVVISKVFNELEKSLWAVSSNSGIQHNLGKEIKRNVSSAVLILNSFGLFVGLFLSLFVIRFLSFRSGFLIFAILILPSLVFFYFIKDDTRVKLKSTIGSRNLGVNLKFLVYLESLFWFAQGASFILIITFLVSDYFNGGIEWIVYLFSLLYFTIVISTFISKKIFKKRNSYLVACVGISFISLAMITIIFSRSLPVLLIAMVLEGIGAGIWTPARMSLFWESVPSEKRESASGYLSGRRLFASGAGPLFGGVLMTYFGVFSPFVFKFLVCMILISGYVYLWKRSTKYLKN